MKITDKNELRLHDTVELRAGKERASGTVENVGRDAGKLSEVTAVWLDGVAYELRPLGKWSLVTADRMDEAAR